MKKFLSVIARHEVPKQSNQSDCHAAARLAMTFTFCFLLLTPAFAAEPIGQFSYIEGRVDRKSAAGTDYIPVVKDEPVFTGDTLRTKGYSRAEISFNDKSIVKIGENSQVELKEYALNAAGVRESARLFIDRGILRAIVSHSATGANNFLIDTPNSMGAVKGSDICVSYLKSASTFLAISGAIETHHRQFPDKAVMVTKGMTTFVPADAPPVTARPFFPVEQDRFEDDTAPMLAKGGKEILPADLSHAIVTAYSGDVRTRTKGAAEWHRAALKETLGEGDEIETGENGSLRLVLESGRIVEMKSNTQLSITKFNVDPKTGHREDLLMSNKGEIRARIEKLKAGSKFEVTTPTAIAAVRGTIMYLNISPVLTHAFFEAGPGSLTSLITGVEKSIDPGQNAQADGQGTVTDPVTTTPEQHQQLENSFNSQDQIYGYSAPDGGSAGDPGLPPTPPGGSDSNAPSNPQGNTIVFDQIPVEIPVEATTSSTDFSTDNRFLNFSTTDNRLTGWGSLKEDSIKVNGNPVPDGNSDNLFSGGGTPGILFSGSFDTGSLPDNKIALWNFDFKRTGSSGGTAFVGRAGGARLDNNVMTGFSKFIYISPTKVNGKYDAGIVSGSLDGNFGPTTGLWSAEGSDPTFKVVSMGTTTVSPNHLFDPGNLQISDTNNEAGVGKFGVLNNTHGDITFGDLYGTSLEIWDDHVNWGIVSFLMGGTFSGEGVAVATPFLASLSGKVVDNQPITEDGTTRTTTSWLVRIDNGEFAPGGKVTGGLKGLWVSIREVTNSEDHFIEGGSITGDVSGNFDTTTGTWQALAIGEHKQTKDSIAFDGLDGLKNFITNNTAVVPIAESRLLNSVVGNFNGNSGTITALANTSFYATTSFADNGMWASLINGSFTGMPANVSSWSTTLTGGTGNDLITATLNGTQWKDSKWFADVSGSSPGGLSFNGSATGTYTPSSEGATDGSLTGAGAGTWNGTPPQNPPN